MHWKFEPAEDIKDYIDAIDGRKEFILVQKDYYDVINYVVINNDTFPEVEETNISDIERRKRILLRDCRGLIFDKKGKILRKPFHKFFNYGERNETRPENVDISKKHIILEKRDGSMVTPLYIEEFDAFRWGTKMGITDTSNKTEVFVVDNQKYNKFARECHLKGLTPIFEWTSPFNRIVIRYDVPELVLLAVRYNISGEYLSYDDTVSFAKEFDIPVVKSFGDTTDVVSFVEDVRNMTGVEGFVVRFDDGHQMKIKCSEYVLIHKSRELVDNDRNVIEALFEDKMDDLLPLLIEEDRKRVTNLVDIYMDSFKYKLEEIDKLFNREIKDKMDRKTFALTYTDLSPIDKAMIFNMMDGKNLIESLKSKYVGLTKTEAKFLVLKKELGVK